MDWASTFFESLNQFVDPVRLLLPLSIFRCMLVIVVEKFNVRVCLMSSIESLANEVGDDLPWTRLNWVLSVSVVFDCFINDVPCEDVIAELGNNMLDICDHVRFKRGLVPLTVDEIGVMSTRRRPDKGMTSKLHVVLFGKVDKISTSSEIVVVEGFGNLVHLALVFGGDEVVLLGCPFSVGFVFQKKSPVNGCANVNMGSLGCFSKGGGFISIDGRNQS